MSKTLETFQNEAESSISPRGVSLYVKASHFMSLSAIFGGNAFRPVQTAPGPDRSSNGLNRSDWSRPPSNRSRPVRPAQTIPHRSRPPPVQTARDRSRHTRRSRPTMDPV